MKIDKDVPIPPRGMPNGKAGLLRSLKKGDSFVMEGSSAAAHALGSQALGGPGHVTVRKIDNNSVRVWRIK